MNHKIAPSLLSADFLNLQRDVEMINNSDADWLHLDIMDGVFVPNISFGFPVLNALKDVCKKPMDVHLMIVEPQKFINEVAATGAYMMNVHYEACTHLHRTITAIREAGMKAGVTLNPHTTVSGVNTRAFIYYWYTLLKKYPDGIHYYFGSIQISIEVLFWE
mgnify:CR=1 FL=1